MVSSRYTHVDAIDTSRSLITHVNDENGTIMITAKPSPMYSVLAGGN